jgi:Cof subfamily protein (haloacid dehalogenase superfamily)
VGYKLVAVDLDGTLLDGRGLPHASDVKALRAASEQGIKVTIVTGRLYSGTRQAAEILGLDGPVACVDGSHVVSTATHTTLFHHGIIGDHAKALRDSLARRGPAAFLFACDEVVHDAAGVPYLEYVTTWSKDVKRVECVAEHDAWHAEAGVTAVVAVGSMQQIIGAAEDIAKALPNELQMATFPTRRIEGSWGMVVRARGGNKGSALGWVADHYGISLEETIAVGDWINDVPMLKVAGRSFAMGQAPESVKEAATDVLDETAYEGGGVARAVKIALGIGSP